ncbi:MAG: rhodanese-like domain-containing protein [Oscillospiraceae bacterium]
MKYTLILTAALLALLFCACSSNTAQPHVDAPSSGGEQQTSGTTGAQYHKITSAAAKKYLDGGAELTLVDVRTNEEFAEGHIEGAINIPNEDIADSAPAALPETDSLILVYCRSGKRSRQAAEKLVALGYSEVYDFGGINSWSYGVVTD